MVAKEDLTEKDFKYLRPGHVDLERECDKFVKLVTSLFPGTGELPQRWKYVSRESFTKRFEHLGPAIWSKTASYHMLIINGNHAFRIWTDSPDTALCDVRDELAVSLSKYFEVMDIPENTLTKTKPFTKRIRIENEKHAKIVLLQTLITFGLIE